MTQREKIQAQFLEDPQSLPLSKIVSFLSASGYIIKQAKGSHTKVVHIDSEIYLSVPIHGNDCKPFYKSALRKLYLSHQQ